jgi:hypothetical protein
MVRHPTEKFWNCLNFTGKFFYGVEQAYLFKYSQLLDIKIEVFNIVVLSIVSNWNCAWILFMRIELYPRGLLLLKPKTLCSATFITNYNCVEFRLPDSDSFRC